MFLINSYSCFEWPQTNQFYGNVELLISLDA